MPNRVLASIASYKARIEQRLASGEITAEKLAEVGKNSDLDFMEFVSFNEVKSLAHAMGLITVEEAQTIYSYLGESGPDKFNASPVEAKTALTQWYGELLRWKIKGARPPRKAG